MDSNVYGGEEAERQARRRLRDELKWQYSGSKKTRAVMDEPKIRFPVTCPECGNELLTEFPVSIVADALVKGTKITLYAYCHDAIWDASELELEQIREYLGAVWLDAHR